MTIGLALATALLVAGPDSVTPRRDTLPPDRWLGVDKIEHVFVAGATYAFSFAAVRAAGVRPRPAIVVSIAPTALVAIGKEVRDRRVTGRFSARDLVADAIGAAAYGLLLARTSR